MKIVHVIPGLTHERGGPTAVVAALARHQSALHEVTVLTTNQGVRHGEQPAELSSGVRIVRCAVQGPDRWSYAASFAAQARRVIASCDLVHVHSIFTYPVHAALRTALALGRPVVLCPHGQLHPYSLQQSRWVKSLYLKCSGAVIRRAVTAWHYTSQAESAASWPQDESSRFVLPNGVEAADYRVDRTVATAAVSERWPELRAVPYALFLGRLTPKKNLPFLVEQFLAAAPAHAKLVVAGPDEAGQWAAIARQVADGANRARLVRMPLVAGADELNLLAAATVFVLPSEHENFGIAALEALAAGTPVMLSREVDLAAELPAPELSAAGASEVLPLDASAWRERLADRFEMPQQDAVQVERRRQWVAARLDSRNLVRSLTDRYRWVIAGCRSVASDAPTASG